MSALLLADEHWSSNDKYDLNNLKDFCLRQLLETYGRRVEHVFHLGDQTDRRHFDAILMSQISKIYLESLSGEISKLIVICGNHDASDRLITPFSTFANGTWANGKGMTIVGREANTIGDFYCRGWESNRAVEYTSVKYFITHARVKEWSGTGEKAFTLAELNALSFDRIILGDTHEHIESGKVLSVGCLFPSSHSDDNLEAGALLFDPDYNDFIRIGIPDYPIFRTLRITEDSAEPDSSYVGNNIVKIVFNGTQKFTSDQPMRNRWHRMILAMEPRVLEIAPDDNHGRLNETESATEVVPLEKRYDRFAETQSWEPEVKAIGDSL